MSDTEQPSPYQTLGGAEALLDLVQRFYGYMDSLPEAAEIRAMHAKDLDGARQKLYKFLSGWLGGPNLYWEEYGHPRLRMRHFPFPIGSAASGQWLLCMRKALDEQPMDPAFREALYAAFAQTAQHMINQ